jgi:putative DNA primase/helicase
VNAPSPYRFMAPQYHAAGWSPIPLPPGQKFPVPTSFTGADGKYVDAAQLKKWTAEKARVSVGNLNYAPGNIALRLPRNVLGVDVDAYGEKAGEATLQAAEADWGALPPTWVSTSRTDGLSGIRLFRIPEGLAWPGELPQGKGVELLRWDHRYAIVYPSVHDKTGAEYKWYLQVPNALDDGLEMAEQLEEFPAPEDLAELPELWVEGLTSGRQWKERAANADMGATEVRDWLAARAEPDALCAATRATVAKYSRELRIAGDDGGAHDSARDAAWAVIGDSAEGHSGVHKALAELRKVFISNVRERRGRDSADGERLAKEEWARIVVRGVQKVAAEGVPEDTDPCVSNAARGNAGGSRGSDAIVWRLDDIGNAERLLRVMDNRARYSDGLGGWVIWDGSVWRLDTDRQMERWAVKAVDTIETDLAYVEGDGDEDTLKAFKRHKKSSGTDGKLKAMVSVARGRRGITVPGELFDARADLLGCANGTLELGDSGVSFRPSREDDYLTLNTGTLYKPEASSKLWDDFLERFQPDPDLREWIAKLVGYSLLGVNSKRLMVVCFGPTSTGKTTFAEAVRTALGGYAKDVNLSIFRDNQDERARPDLVEALPKRIVFAEEVSTAWHMHPDQIKRLTGGAPINARRPFARSYLEMVPAFTPFLLTNGAPTIEGGDEALVRRLRLVPWEEKIAQSEEDPTYLRRLRTEAREAILAWAVAGYVAWRTDARDLADIPVGALAANLAFRDELSDVDRFLAEATVRGPENRELPLRLFEAYERWCDVNRIAQRDRLSMTKFGKQMDGKGYPKKQVRIDREPTWVRVGISISDKWAKLAS